MSSKIQRFGAAARLLWSVSPIVDISRDGWPVKLHVQAIAALQSWRDGDGEETPERAQRMVDWAYAIRSACTDSKSLPHERRVLRQNPMAMGGDVVGVVTESAYYITAPDFSEWLAAHEEAPSPLVAEWFKHQGVASPAPAPAQHAAAPAAAPVAGSASSAPGNARRDLLVPVIEAAQRECEDPFDPPAVWAALSQMAQAGKRPLVGVTEEGIKWNDAEDNPQFFTIASLRDRLRRIKKKAPQSAIRRANTR